MSTKTDILDRITIIRAEVVTIETLVPPACGLGPDYLKDLIDTLSKLDELAVYVTMNV